ncbi:hypothetical protein C3L33_10510, partial [Rhododendron williamsianum]
MERLCLSPSSTLPLKWCVSWGKSDQRYPLASRFLPTQSESPALLSNIKLIKFKKRFQALGNDRLGIHQSIGRSERFFPLSTALLSSVSRSQMGNAVDIFVDIASYLEAVILSLLFCRSGLIFLLHHPELSTNVILALRGSDGLKKEEPLPLQYASVLISKGFVCQPEEIGMIVNAIDRLLTSDAHSEEILWVLCALSRSHCGRQALLAVGHFLE